MGDLAIRGGTVVDGTGTAPYRADVRIVDGRIVEIGARLRAATELDASDRLVTPGFIDIHTHYDAQVMWDSELTPSSWHGVTAVVAGNCGFGIAPAAPAGRATLLRTLEKVEDMRLATLEAGVQWDFDTYESYLDRIERRGTAINFGGYVGHTPVRVQVMGDAASERHATALEIDQMRALVAESLRGGALGFSTDRAGFILGDGGRPVPSIVASQAEVEALMRVCSEVGRGIVHVAPGEDFAWLYEFQQSLGRTITWNSILTYPDGTSARAPYHEKLDAHVRGRSAGADVWAQVTCRPIVQQIVMAEPTPFSVLPAFATLAATALEDRARVYADDVWRARAGAELDSGRWVNPRWPTFTVAESAAHPELIGRSVRSIAADRRCAPFEAVCDIALADGLATRFNVVFANDDQAGVEMLLRGEGCVMGVSDAGAHVGQICDAVMPTDFLANWVRDRATMSIERGVRKLTGEIADVVGIDRGYLRVGSRADVVVFDFEGVSPGATRRVADMPAGGDRLVAEPTGIDHILVNGRLIRRDGVSVLHELDRLPGSVLRSRPVAGRT